MRRYLVPVLFIILVSAILVTGCSAGSSISITSSTTAITTQPKLTNIRLVGTIGPLSIPLACMVEQNSLASIAEKTTLTVWANPTQLQAIISGAQGDFISLPTNSAATFYNRGVPLQLLDASIWNILYLITREPGLKSLTELKGKRVVVPYQGAIPDAMFRFICQKQGIDLNKDIEIYYAADPVQASQFLLSGQEKYVLLSEPSATSVILKGKDAGATLYRSLNIKSEWEKAVGGTSSTPVAGTVVLGNIKNQAGIVNTFKREYQKAIKWMLANPIEAGEAGARVLSEQGFTAAALTESMKNIEWNYVTSVDARASLENFFDGLMQVSPNFTGGKIPDNGFYFGQ